MDPSWRWPRKVRRRVDGRDHSVRWPLRRIPADSYGSAPPVPGIGKQTSAWRCRALLRRRSAVPLTPDFRTPALLPHRTTARWAGPLTRPSEATGSNRCIAEVDDVALNVGIGSIAPIHHPEKLTLEPCSVAIGTGACRMPPLEIPLRHARRQTMSGSPQLRLLPASASARAFAGNGRRRQFSSPTTMVAVRLRTLDGDIFGTGHGRTRPLGARRIAARRQALEQARVPVGPDLRPYSGCKIRVIHSTEPAASVRPPLLSTHAKWGCWRCLSDLIAEPLG